MSNTENKSSAGRPLEFPVKFTMSISEGMDTAINDWRRKQDDIPARTEAIRRLVELALKQDAK